MLHYYKVGNKKIITRNQAIYESVVNNEPIDWYFSNEVWENFSKHKLDTLGSKRLDELYKIRALNLREKYDYLILNYSGGADSHNVLMTFLNNNIHLDEINVVYSNKVDSKIYTPNKNILSADNIFSEYDYAIKPTLEMVSKLYPKIKITIQDIFEKKFSVNDDTFTQYSSFTGAFELIRQGQITNSISELPSSKKIANIFGIDKPDIICKNNMFFIYFRDKTFNVGFGANKHQSHPNVIYEMFYWDPSMPEIVFEQAFTVLQYCRKNNQALELFKYTKESLSLERYENIRQLTTNLLYTTWDNKFQVKKPIYFNKGSRNRDKYYLNHKEFSDYLEEYYYYRLSWLTFTKDATYKVYCTPWYYIGSI